MTANAIFSLELYAIKAGGENRLTHEIMNIVNVILNLSNLTMSRSSPL